MEYRGGMIPDQWPRSVQADIAAVKEAVQNVDVDTQSVKDAVESMNRNLTVFLGVLFQGSNNVQTSTRTTILERMTSDLTAVRTAVEARAAGAVLLPLYPAVGSASPLFGWARVDTVPRIYPAGTSPTTWSACAIPSESSPGRYFTAYIPYSLTKLRELLAEKGIHSLPLPTTLPAVVPPRRWWHTWLRPRRRPVALGLSGGTT